MGPFEQKIQLVLLIVTTVAAVLAVIVPLLRGYRRQSARIDGLDRKVALREIEHQRVLICLEQKIAELQRAKTVLITKARHDTKRLRGMERRLQMLETKLAMRDREGDQDVARSLLWAHR